MQINYRYIISFNSTSGVKDGEYEKAQYGIVTAYWETTFLICTNLDTKPIQLILFNLNTKDFDVKTHKKEKDVMRHEIL